MTPERRLLVIESWKILAPQGAALGATFYRRLFEMDPAFRELFSSSIREEQINKLTTMLDLIVLWLDVPEHLVPALKQLGARHASYGVLDEHYGKFGAALIGTLEEGLGDRFTTDMRSAWNEAYVLVSSLMRRGAAKVSGAFPVFSADPPHLRGAPVPEGDAA